VIAVNKWDHVAPERREEIRDELALRLRFLDFAPVHYISALHGSGVGELMDAVRAAHAAAMREMPTPDLTRVLEAAIRQHQPPLVRGRRIRLRYAHQGGRNPPVIVVHGAQAERTPEDYRRYLANCFREAFRLKGTPVRVDMRSEANPFAGRRDKLTPRQRRTRARDARRSGR
jgi:GTP-binding protein